MKTNNLTIAAQTIKDSVSALDVGQAMGLEIRRGRCKCPIHNGRDFNCVLYRGNRGFYCHVCKSGGDVISFVQQYYNMQFPDAVRWFNDTFGLGLDIESPMSQEAVKQAENAQRKRAWIRETQEQIARMRFDLMLIADRLVERMEDMRDEHRPRTYGEKWDARFCTAVELLPDARRLVDDCMMECIEVRNDA